MSDIVEPPSMQLSQLRSRTSEARNKMDRHRVLLDRYLPAPTGPIPAVEYEVETKYDELAQRYADRLGPGRLQDTSNDWNEQCDTGHIKQSFMTKKRAYQIVNWKHKETGINAVASVS